MSLLLLPAALLGACASPAGHAAGERAGDPPNILLVTLDTFRADRLGTYGGPAHTPNIDALAALGTVFLTAESPANESALAHAALLTGRWPSAVLSADYADYVVPPVAELLSERLKAAGYHTAAFVAGGHVDGRYGFAQGWDRFSAEPGFGSFSATVPKALDWLATAEPPWFVWVHGYDAHLPYATPGPWAPATAPPGDAGRWASDAVAAERVVGGRYDPERPIAWFRHVSGEQVVGLDAEPGGRPVRDDERAWLHGRYDAALGFADAWIGRLLHPLSGRSDTLVILVGDHGEDLVDHGFVNHRHGLQESCIHVPLIVAGPGFAAERTTTPVSTRSIYATVLAALNLPRPGATPGAVEGPPMPALGQPVARVGPPLQRVLAGHDAEPVLFSEGVAGMLAARRGDWKLVLHRVDRGVPLTATAGEAALYDLAADPHERDDVALAHPDVVAALREAMVAWSASIPRDGAAAPPVPPWLKQELREHGYW